MSVGHFGGQENHLFAPNDHPKLRRGDVFICNEHTSQGTLIPHFSPWSNHREPEVSAGSAGKQVREGLRQKTIDPIHIDMSLRLEPNLLSTRLVLHQQRIDGGRDWRTPARNSGASFAPSSRGHPKLECDEVLLSQAQIGDAVQISIQSTTSQQRVC